MFKDVFKLSQDDDFVIQHGASAEEVNAFTTGRGAGPNPDNLRFDFIGRHSNAWNKTAVSLLAEEFERRRMLTAEPLRLPKRPRAYVEKALTEKWQRCRQLWVNARPRMTDTGQIENEEQVEERISRRKADGMKSQRHNSRRTSVSNPSSAKDKSLKERCAEISSSHTDY